jgi:predicted metalloprotease
MNVKVDLDADAVGAIVRTAVAEARHQEKVEAALTPVRQKIRAQRLAAARARLEGN